MEAIFDLIRQLHQKMFRQDLEFNTIADIGSME